jgi:hypothetical protein
MKDSNLDFDGMGGDGVNRAGNKWSGNQFASTMKENFGTPASARKGNASSSAMDVGPSATKDKKSLTIATAAQGGKINGGATAKGFGNPDKINVGNK